MTDTSRTDQLLKQVASGDADAAAQLLQRHRQRLRRMVAIRLDNRIAARVDPSDILQETMVEAAERLPDYSQTQPIPFYPWLRQLALERVTKAHRHHIDTQKRSVHREAIISDASQDLPVEQLLQTQTSVAGAAMREELKDQVRTALSRVSSSHREILVLIFLEQLSTTEAAAVLGIKPEAVRSRQLRALDQFAKLIRPFMEGR